MIIKSSDMSYAKFLEGKSHSANEFGFEPADMPSFLFEFQAALVGWSLITGRAGIFADCGLGKTPMQLVWADQIMKHLKLSKKKMKPILILTPLAVSFQTAAEAHKFSIEAARSVAGEITAPIMICNYERLKFFNPDDFSGVACDESSILKSFDGAMRQEITTFMRKVQYRSLWSATAAPNDYTELGTSSEALGYLGHMDMLQRFFKNDQNTVKPMTYRHHGQNFAKLDDAAKWRFKGHAETPFWQWVCSWARAVRRPSDLGFSDEGFILPPLIERDHLVDLESPPDGMLFALPAVGLKEQREERRRSITERCHKVAELVDTRDQALVWCHLNDEGDLLEELIPDACQVSGQDSDEDKEAKFVAFSNGSERVLITKPKIGAWGLNFQNCAHVTFFPSHSYEQYYQGVRRCWRFGQKFPVTVDIVTTEGEKSVLKNLQRKAVAADRMFSSLVAEMNRAQGIGRPVPFIQQETMPSWL
jgi:hypothetical protein